MILVNKARCRKCGLVIESKHRHDFKWCECGAIFVDGGKDYLRRGGDMDACEELSETIEQDRGVSSALIGLVLFALLASPSYAEHVVPSVPLGADGLDIVVTLRLLPSGSSTETDQSTTGVAITDHGDGSYGFSGLPDATGRDRYVLLAATAEEPGRHLFRYEYGAESGTSIVYETVDSTVAQEPIVQGDTFGTISYIVLSGLPSNIGSATATFTAVNARTKSAIVSDRPAVISNVTLNATTNTYGATFTYDLESTFTTNPVSYSAEFTITIPGGEQITLPRTPIRGEIRKQL